MIILPITKKPSGTWPEELYITDNGPGIIKSNTGYSYASEFAKLLSEDLKERYNIDLSDKKVLDVGMGNGTVLDCLRKYYNADVYGFDIESYLNYRYEGRTFPNTDIRDMPEELFGTFDVAYQRYFSVPFKDITSVLLAIAKALKPNGVYLVLFDDKEHMDGDPFIIKMLKEIYETVEVWGRNDCIATASNPRLNPVVTPIETYYYVLTEEEFEIYKKAKPEEGRKLLLASKNKRNNLEE